MGISQSMIFPRPEPSSYDEKTFRSTSRLLLYIPRHTKPMHNEPDMSSMFSSSSSMNDTKTTQQYPPIPTLFIRKENDKRLIIYSHGNAEDLGVIAPVLQLYADRFDAHILAFDYPSYGVHNGPSVSVPSESSVNSCIAELFLYVTRVWKYPSERIYFFGRSLGTGITIQFVSQLCQHNIPIGGIILLSAYTSIQDIATELSPLSFMVPLMVPDIWRSIDIIEHITSPILLLHGQDDSVIPANHSKLLFDKCVNSNNKHIHIFNGDHNQFNINELTATISKYMGFNIQTSNNIQHVNIRLDSKLLIACDYSHRSYVPYVDDPVQLIHKEEEEKEE